MSTTVRITNTYADRENTETVEVESPEWSEVRDYNPDTEWDPLVEWWEDVVFPYTGDGKGQSQYAVYAAEVVASDIPGLVGQTYEWDG